MPQKAIDVLRVVRTTGQPPDGYVGGRVFATHYSYVWLFNDSPFSTTASWAVQGASPANDPQIA